MVIIKKEACWSNKVGSNRLTTKVPFASLADVSLRWQNSGFKIVK